MSEGNYKKLKVNGGVGLIFSRLSIEGPIKRDTSSFLVAARRSYIDLLSGPFLEDDMKDALFNFYDLTAKVNYRINARNNLFLSGTLAQAHFGQSLPLIGVMPRVPRSEERRVGNECVSTCRT